MKPSFFRSTELYLAEIKANAGRSGSYMNVRIAFAGLFTAADRSGRFKWRPEELKLDCLPYDQVDFAEVLEVLRTSGDPPFIVRYEVDGKPYGLIPTFTDHQRPHHTEAPSTIPGLNGELTVREPLDNGYLTGGKGKEGKGREEEGKEYSTQESPSPAILDFPTVGSGPKSWPLVQNKISEYQTSFPGIDILSECRKARQWCVDNPSRRKTFKGMPAFLSRWLGRAQDSDQVSRATIQQPTKKEYHDKFCAWDDGGAGCQAHAISGSRFCSGHQRRFKPQDAGGLTRVNDAIQPGGA